MTTQVKGKSPTQTKSPVNPKQDDGSAVVVNPDTKAPITEKETSEETPIEKEELKSQQAIKKEETPIEEDSSTKKEVSSSSSKVKQPIEDVKIDPDDKSKIQTNFQKLSGLKKTGEVIDLDSIKKKEEKVEESKKKRRKRISKDVSKPKDLANKFNKNNKQNNSNQKVEPTSNEIQKQIRETLEKLQGKSSKSKGAKYRKEQVKFGQGFFLIYQFQRNLLK
jgi:translation initiation factor IF-2